MFFYVLVIQGNKSHANKNKKSKKNTRHTHTSLKNEGSNYLQKLLQSRETKKTETARAVREQQFGP